MTKNGHPHHLKWGDRQIMIYYFEAEILLIASDVTANPPFPPFPPSPSTQPVQEVSSPPLPPLAPLPPMSLRKLEFIVNTDEDIAFHPFPAFPPFIPPPVLPELFPFPPF